MLDRISIASQIGRQLFTNVCRGFNNENIIFLSNGFHAHLRLQFCQKTIVIGCNHQFQRIMILLLDLFSQSLNPAAGDQAASYEDSYPVADLLNLIKLV